MVLLMLNEFCEWSHLFQGYFTWSVFLINMQMKVYFSKPQLYLH